MLRFENESVLNGRYFVLILLIGILILTESGCSTVKENLSPHEPLAEFSVRVIEADSPSQEDVQAAIDLAEDGDIVLIPPGTAVWSTPNSNKPAVKIDRKGITLMGTGIDKVFITDNTGDSWGEDTLQVIGELGKPFRISGFSFQGGVIGISGNALGWRIDNCEFTNDSGLESIGINGFTRGVIDYCTFKNCRVVVREDAYGVAAWKRPLRLGTADAVYLEDNDFERTVFGNTIDANSGGQYVFRYNTVINSSCEAHSLQNASPISGKFQRATRSYEIYYNEFIAEDNGASHANWDAISVRGGTGVIFGNRVENISGDAYNLFGVIDNVRSFREMEYPLLKADGTNPLDGNEEPNGYPALDQIGRSTDAGPGDNYHPQAHEPLYIWDNEIDGNLCKVKVHNTGEGSLVDEHIKENRDFFHEEHPSYMPYVYPHPVAENKALVLVPLSSTVLRKGQRYMINWDVKEDIVKGTLILQLYQGSDMILDIAELDVSDASYSWTVPETLAAGEHYRIRIFQGAIMDISAEFTVE